MWQFSSVVVKSLQTFDKSKCDKLIRLKQSSNFYFFCSLPRFKRHMVQYESPKMRERRWTGWKATLNANKRLTYSYFYLQVFELETKDKNCMWKSYRSSRRLWYFFRCLTATRCDENKCYLLKTPKKKTHWVNLRHRNLTTTSHHI